jgi:hypothetical protein
MVNATLIVHECRTSTLEILFFKTCILKDRSKNCLFVFFNGDILRCLQKIILRINLFFLEILAI